MSNDVKLEQSVQKEVERFIGEWMTEMNVPSSSVSIVTDGKRSYSKGFGSRNLEENAPATSETLYGIGSCSKSFTALSIMQLVETGELTLDDPVDEHLPFDLGSSDDPITIHHLLNHSSGAPSDGYAHVLIARMADYQEKGIPMGDYDDLQNHINGAADEICADPGTKFFYYNSGYAMLGQIVEQVSGKAFHEYVTEHIFEPLEMERTTYEKQAFKADENAMTAYKMGEDGPSPSAFPFHDLIYAAGGMLSPVDELANYLEMNLNGGEYDGETIIDEESLAKMYEGYIETGPGISGISSQQYGYGWARTQFFDETLIGHSGSIGVSTAYMGFIPDQEIGVAITCNASPGHLMEAVGQGVLAILFGKDWKSEVPFFAIRYGLEELTGTYRSYRGVNQVSIRNEGGILRISSEVGYPPWPDIPVIPKNIEAGEFYTMTETGEKQPIQFDIDDNGNIDLYIDRWRLHKQS